MLIAGFIAASMDSAGMLIAKASGIYEYGALQNVFIMHFPNYLMLGVAVVISHVVTRLGQQVTREREMGSYRLGELLGRGGMGEVYLATHRMLARPAAIKLIRPEVLASGDGMMAQTATARFRREAEAAAKLRSPHTVELYDFGVTEDGTLYLVMEFLEGTNLERLVRTEGPLPAARVIHILRQVCESLEEAHAQGLVHRDIKPANIHLGKLGLRHASLHGARAGARPDGGRPRRPVFARLRRLLPPHRQAGLRGRHAAPDDLPASAASARAALTTDGAADPRRPGSDRARVPRQAARGSAAERRGSERTARRGRERRC
jgi:hypothetical protein